MWVLVAIAIELIALVGVVSALTTGRTHVAFVLGFNTMAFVTGTFIWHFGLGARAVVVLVMVVVYLVRMNWVLFVWSGQTSLENLDNSPIAGKLAIPMVLTNTAGWAYCLPLYFFGTAFHFGADYQKRRFKCQHGPEGPLLNTGVWAL